jgi:hypothetical protein
MATLKSSNELAYECLPQLFDTPAKYVCQILARLGTAPSAESPAVMVGTPSDLCIRQSCILPGQKCASHISVSASASRVLPCPGLYVPEIIFFRSSTARPKHLRNPSAVVPSSSDRMRMSIRDVCNILASPSLFSPKMPRSRAEVKALCKKVQVRNGTAVNVCMSRKALRVRKQDARQLSMDLFCC